MNSIFALLCQKQHIKELHNRPNIDQQYSNPICLQSFLPPYSHQSFLPKFQRALSQLGIQLVNSLNKLIQPNLNRRMKRKRGWSHIAIVLILYIHSQAHGLTRIRRHDQTIIGMSALPNLNKRRAWTLHDTEEMRLVLDASHVQKVITPICIKCNGFLTT